MKLKVISLLGAILIVYLLTTTSLLIWGIKENNAAQKSTNILAKRLSDLWISDKFLQDVNKEQRHLILQNTIKDVDYFLSVVHDIDSVNISKTLDRDTYVIAISDSKNRCVSLWLNNQGQVVSVTSY